MFAIAQEQRDYLTYILRDEATQTEVEVVPERGGLITRWRMGEQDILYLDKGRFAQLDLSVRGGIPILFPICGNLPDNRFDYHDQTYELKQHGFARDLPWAVVHQSTEGSASLTLELVSDERTRSHYPFDFALCLTYQLQGQSLKILQRISNRSSQPMPFSLGFHPYFQVQDKSQLDFQIPAKAYLDQKTGDLRTFDGKFNWELPEIDAAFVGTNRHWAGFRDRNQNWDVTLHYSHDFSTVVFWTLKDKDYICLEPWTAPRNALNTGDRLIVLVPDAEFEGVFELRLSAIT
jgi:galactose mutarotase-like enzyme